MEERPRGREGGGGGVVGGERIISYEKDNGSAKYALDLLNNLCSIPFTFDTLGFQSQTCF